MLISPIDEIVRKVNGVYNEDLGQPRTCGIQTVVQETCTMQLFAGADGLHLKVSRRLSITCLSPGYQGQDPHLGVRLPEDRS